MSKLINISNTFQVLKTIKKCFKKKYLYTSSTDYNDNVMPLTCKFKSWIHGSSSMIDLTNLFKGSL